MNIKIDNLKREHQKEIEEHRQQKTSDIDTPEKNVSAC